MPSTHWRGLGKSLWPSVAVVGNIRGSGAFSRHRIPGRKLELPGPAAWIPPYPGRLQRGRRIAKTRLCPPAAPGRWTAALQRPSRPHLSERSAPNHAHRHTDARPARFFESTLPPGKRAMAFDNLMVFTGNANPKLSQQVARQLIFLFSKILV